MLRRFPVGLSRPRRPPSFLTSPSRLRQKTKRRERSPAARTAHGHRLPTGRGHASPRPVRRPPGAPAGPRDAPCAMAMPPPPAPPATSPSRERRPCQRGVRTCVPSGVCGVQLFTRALSDAVRGAAAATPHADARVRSGARPRGAEDSERAPYTIRHKGPLRGPRTAQPLLTARATRASPRSVQSSRPREPSPTRADRDGHRPQP